MKQAFSRHNDMELDIYHMRDQRNITTYKVYTVQVVDTVCSPGSQMVCL